LFCPPLGQVVAGGSWPACTAQPSRVVGESPSAGLGLPPRATGVFGYRTLAVHSNLAGNRTCIARGGSARGKVSAIAELSRCATSWLVLGSMCFAEFFDASLARLILGCVLLRKLFRRIPPRRNCFREISSRCSITSSVGAANQGSLCRCSLRPFRQPAQLAEWHFRRIKCQRRANAGGSQPFSPLEKRERPEDPKSTNAVSLPPAFRPLCANGQRANRQGAMADADGRTRIEFSPGLQEP
jgi:hypothetical protein